MKQSRPGFIHTFWRIPVVNHRAFLVLKDAGISRHIKIYGGAIREDNTFTFPPFYTIIDIASEGVAVPDFCDILVENSLEGTGG